MILTPIGRYGGTLSRVRIDDLATVPLMALMDCNREVDRQDAVVVSQEGSQQPVRRLGLAIDVVMARVSEGELFGVCRPVSLTTAYFAPNTFCRISVVHLTGSSLITASSIARS